LQWLAEDARLEGGEVGVYIGEFRHAYQNAGEGGEFATGAAWGWLGRGGIGLGEDGGILRSYWASMAGKMLRSIPR
jgi:hypothetical protein